MDATAATPLSDGLAGVLVWTSHDRFDAMAGFYRDVLGLTPRSERPGFVNFEWGSVRLTVAVHSDVTGRALDPGRLMVNLATADIEVAHGTLVGRGIEFSRPPERESWGFVATFSDPDGNVLQLIQPD